MADLPATLAPLQVTGNAKGRLIFCPSVAATPGSPRAYVRVTRWLASTGEWKTLAKLMLPGTAVTSASYVDSSTIKDDRVRYAMRIINQDGTQQEAVHSSAFADAWQIGPKAPVIKSVTRTAPDRITVRYLNPSWAASKIRFYLAASGDGGKTFGSGALAAEFDAPARSATTVRAYTLTVSPTLTYKVQAAATTTNPVELVTEAKASFFPTALKNVWSGPSIPSLLGPFADQLAGKITFSWSPKPTDGTGQTGAQVEHRPVDGATTTITITGDAATAQTAAALATGQYEWRARTKHASGAYGPWSGWSEFAVTTTPSLTISYPDDGQTVPTNKPALLLDWYSPSGATIATWGARLKQGATVLESRAGKGPVPGVRFARALADGQSYTVEVWATASNGLATATDTVTFPVSYLRPATPAVTLARWWPDDGYVGVVATYDTAREYAWLGAVNASASVLRIDGVETARNRATVPRPASGSVWSVAWGTGGAGTTAYMYQLIKATWTTASTGGSRRIRANSAVGESVIPVTPGKTITVSADIASNRNARVSVDFNLGASWVSSVASSWGAVSTDVANPSRLAWTGTVPAGVDRVIVFAEVWTPGVGDWIAAGRLQVESGSVATDYIDGYMTSHAGAAATALERSVDGGETWARVSTGPGGAGDLGLQDVLAPSGLDGVLYRAVAISALGVESYSTSAAVETRPSGDVWLVGADGTRCRLSANIQLDAAAGQDVVLEHYYRHEKPTAHYGDARPVKIGISGTLYRGEGLEDDWAGLLGQPVHYRDPDGRHGWGTLDATGVTHPGSTWTEQRPLALTWEATDYDPDDDGDQ